MKRKDVIVIGGGPAGVAAAIELSLLGVDSLLIEMDEIGGLVRNAHLVTNYPGFPRGIGGRELARLFRMQLRAAGVEIVHEHVLNVRFRGGTFTAETASDAIDSRTLVVASGTKAREIAGLRISESARPRVFYEVSRIFGVSGKKMVVIGSGDVAFDYAMSLSARNEVIVVGRGAAPKCNAALLAACRKRKRIDFMRMATVKRIDAMRRSLILTCDSGAAAREERIDADYALIAIGREPCLDFFAGSMLKRLDILRKKKVLHLIGDAANGTYRQTGICVGDGIRAAMEIHDTLGDVES